MRFNDIIINNKTYNIQAFRQLGCINSYYTLTFIEDVIKYYIAIK